MKSVCAPGTHVRTRHAGRGAAAMRSLTCIRHLSNAECGWCCAVFATIIVKIVHSSLKMNVNVYKLMKMNNCERF